IFTFPQNLFIVVEILNSPPLEYPCYVTNREEDKDGCMRIDVIEEFIREVQQEEAMSKLQAKQARYNDSDDTNHNFVMQKIVEEVQKIPYKVQKIEDQMQKIPTMMQQIDEGVQQNPTNVQNFGSNV
ncbi:hypothetical protein PIB30_084806, partial [Stylosanthes scabra]|nr:hypothetical protein [Stylosanthes scabra]